MDLEGLGAQMARAQAEQRSALVSAVDIRRQLVAAAEARSPYCLLLSFFLIIVNILYVYYLRDDLLRSDV